MSCHADSAGAAVVLAALPLGGRAGGAAHAGRRAAAGTGARPSQQDARGHHPRGSLQR